MLGGGGLLLASAVSPPAAAQPAGAVFTGQVVVDVHCHVFNASDLPITGFLAHHVPGLAEVSGQISPLPEAVLRRLVGFVHGLLNRRTPGAAEDLQTLTAATAAGTSFGPVRPFQLSPQDLVKLSPLVDEIGALFRIGSSKLRDSVKRLADVIALVTAPRATVAATLVHDYPGVDLFTPCLIDYDYWSSDHPETSAADQIAVHGALARASMRGLVGRAGARLHPFVAFDPLREVMDNPPSRAPYRPYGPGTEPFVPGQPYRCPSIGAGAPALPAPGPRTGALALVRHAIEQAGFAGVKLYPPVGFLPFDNTGWLGKDSQRARDLDAALTALYAYCQAEEVPITAHASPANGYALGYGDLARPDNWIPVLKRYPDLRLNLGHLGHGHGIDANRGVKACEAWLRQGSALIAACRNVYADLSNSPLVYDPDYASRLVANLKALQATNPRLLKRLMYGSDWWMNRFGTGFGEAVTRFTRVFEDAFGPEVRQDILGRNALRFLGILDDDNRFVVRNRNRGRMSRLYGTEPPGWLGGPGPSARP